MSCIAGSHKKIGEHHQSSDEKESTVPHSLTTVGGHNENFSVVDGFLIKRTNKTEARFYQRANDQKFGLTSFLPACADVQHVKECSGPKVVKEFSKVTLEDLRADFVKPLIFDIKLGIKTVSSKELRSAGTRRSAALCKDLTFHVADAVSSSKSRGYRFVGSSVSKRSRHHMGIHPDEMIEEMSSALNKCDLKAVIDEIDKLLRYLSPPEGRRFELIGASLLVVAESDADVIANGTAQKPKIKLIDFAHSNLVGPNGMFLSNGVLATSHRRTIYQKGLRFGVENLSQALKTALQQRS